MARGGHIHSIQELGGIRENKAIPVLKVIADGPDFPPTKKNAEGAIEVITARQAARVALARIGERKYLDEFISGLSSSNAEHRGTCVYHLGRIGDKRAVKHLIPFLDDPLLEDKTNRALTGILPQVASEFIAKRGGKGVKSPDDWQAWWESHRSEFEAIK